MTCLTVILREQAARMRRRRVPRHLFSSTSPNCQNNYRLHAVGLGIALHILPDHVIETPVPSGRSGHPSWPARGGSASQAPGSWRILCYWTRSRERTRNHRRLPPRRLSGCGLVKSAHFGFTGRANTAFPSDETVAELFIRTRLERQVLTTIHEFPEPDYAHLRSPPKPHHSIPVRPPNLPFWSRGAQDELVGHPGCHSVSHRGGPMPQAPVALHASRTGKPASTARSSSSSNFGPRPRRTPEPYPRQRQETICVPLTDGATATRHWANTHALSLFN